MTTSQIENKNIFVEDLHWAMRGLWGERQNPLKKGLGRGGRYINNLKNS